MGKPYDDPEKLAEARYHGGEEHSQQEMADYLDCSKGTISLRMRKFSDELAEYGPEDFEHIQPETEDNGDTFPLDLSLPEEWPPDQDVIDTYFGTGVDPEIAVDEASWGCPVCYPALDTLLQEEFGSPIGAFTNT